MIVFFHGGGYVSGDKKSTKYDCQILASKGYTVATVNYRLGYAEGSRGVCDPFNVSGAMDAFYRGQQDAGAALRYLVNNAAKYSIDTSWIFVEGQSAGAGIALSLAYYTQDSLDHYLPGLSDDLGLLKTSGNNLTNSYTIKGIGSMWGGLLFTDNILTQKNTRPTIFFHGEKDAVVPFDVAHLYFCQAFPLDYGSKALYDMCIKYNVPAVMHADPLGIHGVYDRTFNEENIACFFTSIIAGHPESGYYTTEVTNCD